jgi:hypothetical protein
MPLHDGVETRDMDGQSLEFARKKAPMLTDLSRCHRLSDGFDLLPKFTRLQRMTLNVAPEVCEDIWTALPQCQALTELGLIGPSYRDIVTFKAAEWDQLFRSLPRVEQLIIRQQEVSSFAGLAEMKLLRRLALQWTQTSPSIARSLPKCASLVKVTIELEQDEEDGDLVTRANDWMRYLILGCHQVPEFVSAKVAYFHRDTTIPEQTRRLTKATWYCGWRMGAWICRPAR